MTSDIRKAIVVIVGVLTLTNILSLCAIFYVKSQSVKTVATTTLAEPGSVPDGPPAPGAGNANPGIIQTPVMPTGAPMPAPSGAPMPAPSGAPMNMPAPSGAPMNMPAPAMPVSGPAGGGQIPATPDPAAAVPNPNMAPPGGEGAGPVGMPGGPTLNVFVLPPTEIMYGIVKLQETQKYRLDAQQAKAAEAVLNSMAQSASQDAVAASSFLAMVSATLTPDQVKAMRGQRNPAALGMPGPDGTDPVQAAVLTLLQERAGGDATGTPAPVMGAGLPIPPEELMSGLLALEQNEKLKITKDQAAKLLPYAKAHAEAEGRKVQNKNALLKILRQDQQDFIMSIHSDAKPVPVTGPQDVLAALRKA